MKRDGIQGERFVHRQRAKFELGRDVAQALGYSNVWDALAKHVDEEDKNTLAIREGNKGNPNQTIINESGLYSLIMSGIRFRSPIRLADSRNIAARLEDDEKGMNQIHTPGGTHR